MQLTQWKDKQQTGSNYLQTIHLIKNCYLRTQLQKTQRQKQNKQTKKKCNPIKTPTKDMKWHFSEDIQMANKHMKRFSTELAIRECK